MARRRRRYVWTGDRPPNEVLRARTRRELAIVRPEGYRAVKDAFGDTVLVQLGRVLNELAFPQQQPHKPKAPTKKLGKQREDENRWRFIPAVIPTLKQALDRYVRREVDPKSGEPRNVYTYIADLPRAGGQPGEEALLFVEVAKEVPELGQTVFWTLLPRKRDGELQAAIRKAGRLERTRRNPHRALVTRAPVPAGRDGHRHPGAAPDLGRTPPERLRRYAQSTTRTAERTIPLDRLLLVGVGALALLGLARQRQQLAA